MPITLLTDNECGCAAVMESDRVESLESDTSRWLCDGDTVMCVACLRRTSNKGTFTVDLHRAAYILKSSKIFKNETKKIFVKTNAF